MTDQEILDNAPSLADEIGIYDGEFIYICNSDNGHPSKLWLDDAWVFSELCDCSQYIRVVRSLSDIREIERLKLENKTQQSYIDNALDNSKEALISRIAELEKERNDLADDLLETENNLVSLQSKFEDIETVFCDEDGRLIIEPFNGEGLSNWLKTHNLEQQALMCEWIRSNMPDLSNRIYMDINNKSRELRRQAKELSSD